MNNFTESVLVFTIAVICSRSTEALTVVSVRMKRSAEVYNMKNYRPEILSERSCGKCKNYRILFGKEQDRYGNMKTKAKGFYCGKDPKLYPITSEVMTCDEWKRGD